MYWSPIALRSVFDLEKYYEHWMLFVCGLMLLLLPSISKSEVNLAKKLLFQFYEEFEKLYGLQHCSINVHMLSHLASTVERFGPLWCTSCFAFDSMNFEAKKLIHGSGFVLLQVRNEINKSEIKLFTIKNKIKKIK